jgi:hypothetical protein
MVAPSRNVAIRHIPFVNKFLRQRPAQKQTDTLLRGGIFCRVAVHSNTMPALPAAAIAPQKRNQVSRYPATVNGYSPALVSAEGRLK